MSQRKRPADIWTFGASPLFATFRAARAPRGRRAGAMLVLPRDDDASDAADARTAVARAWGRTLRVGTDEEKLECLREMRRRVDDDEEWTRAIGCVDQSLTRVIDGDGSSSEVRASASEVFEACSKPPPGAAWPAFGRAQEATWVAAHVGSQWRPLSLRLRVRNDRTVSAMVWHSCLVLGRWFSRAEVARWFADTFAGATRRFLEIGGGNCIAGMAFAAQIGDGKWDVVLTDADAEAVRNTMYNASKQDSLRNRSVRCETLDWNADEDFCARHGARTFDVIIGTDVVHEESMAPGVLRALDRYLAPDGLAIVVNPAPHSRGGAASFQKLLDERAWRVETHHGISNSILCVGIEEECEDVPLDFYVIRRRETIDLDLPPMQNLGK